MTDRGLSFSPEANNYHETTSQRPRGIASGMMVLWVFLLYPATSFSQDESSAPRALQVGVIAASPLYMQTADGRWEGFGAELWQDLAQQLDVPFEFREFGSLENLIGALKNQEIDVFPSLPVGERFESILDFSQS